MAVRFSNNAAGTLSVGIDDSTTTIVLAGEPSASRFASLNSDSRDFQRATLSNKDMPDTYEIVHIREQYGLHLTVERGAEGPAPVAWPAGTSLSARITAGMLEGLSSVLQHDDGSGRQFKTPFGNFVVNGRLSPGEPGVVQISGYHALQTVRDRVDWSYGLDYGHVDMNMTRESVGATAFVHLGDGVPATWTPGNEYSDGDWVAPPTPTGFHYFLEMDPDVDSDISKTTSPPGFDEWGSCPSALDGEVEVGQWVSVPVPLDIPLKFGNGRLLLLSEVGFICYVHDATTAPTVSIGTIDNPTQFADNIVLSQITGEYQAHRVHVTTGGALVSRLRFKVESPADGTFYGRFYWRGLFVLEP